MTGADFLASLVGEQVRLTPDRETSHDRPHQGALVAVMYADPEDPILVVRTSDRRSEHHTPWSQVCRLQVGTTIPLTHPNRPRGARR